MTMIEETVIEKPRRKKAKARAKPRATATAPASETKDEPFGGLNATECSYDCTPGKCVISGMNLCGHPNKGGGSQAAIQNNPEAMARYNAARRQIAMQAASKK
jgi:hypothetical protein